MLKKEFRIRKGKEYREVYRKGKRVAGKYVIIFCIENRYPTKRFGIVTSKKIGGAVVRNRAKRQLREIARNMGEKVKANYDLVIVARPAIKDCVFKALEKDFLVVIKKAGLC
ncbi:MAG: ribonuclease P protein component [Syntrophomonas sp.]